MVLALPTAALALLIVRPAWPQAGPRDLRRGAIVATVVASVLVTAATGAAAFTRTFQRFATSGEPRPALWADRIYAIEQYWPGGGGVDNESGFDLRHFAAVVRANLLLIGVIVAACLGLALILTMVQAPCYTARSSVQINDASQQVLGVG